MFQVSGGLCLFADVIQRQHLLVCVRDGDGDDRQSHMELSRTTPGYYTQSPSFYNSL